MNTDGNTAAIERHLAEIEEHDAEQEAQLAEDLLDDKSTSQEIAQYIAEATALEKRRLYLDRKYLSEFEGGEA
jgi:hypothetical protein